MMGDSHSVQGFTILLILQSTSLAAQKWVGVVAATLHGDSSADACLWYQVAIIDAEIRHGLLMLRPENVLVLGGKVIVWLASVKEG